MVSKQNLVLDGLANPFAGIRDNRVRTRILVANHLTVPTRTIVLVEEPTSIGINLRTMDYVSLLQTLAIIKISPNYAVAKVQPSTDDEKLQDFSDGDYFKRHPLFSVDSDAFRIQLFFDGFEVTNAIGPKTGIHHMGGIYYRLLNVRPEYRAALNSIFLLALVYTTDISHPQIGWKNILAEFNRELALLERDEGVGVCVNGVNVNLRGSIAQVVCDNLGAHQLFGLTQCFSGDEVYVSRFCFCKGSDIQNRLNTNHCVPRTDDDFRKDALEAETSGKPCRGVVFPCAIESEYFRISENYAADAHHDVAEGLIPLMLKALLKQFIQIEKYFTLEKLNNRIIHFEYGRIDASNKPTPITEHKLKRDPSRTLKQHASQYLCLLRKMPFLVGDCVPTDDPYWHLLITVVEVVQFIWAPSLTRGQVDMLDQSIRIMMSSYRRLFPNERITPKLHNVMQYPRLIREIGPLTHHMAMRFESKHQFFKRRSQTMCNFKNVPHTLSSRHQSNFADVIENAKLFHHDRQFLGMKMDPEEALKDSVKGCYRGVIENGTEFRKNDTVMLDVDGFGRIVDVMKGVNDTILFRVKELEVLYFCDHFYAHRVMERKRAPMRVVAIDDLLLREPLSVHDSYERSNRRYVGLRYPIPI